MFIKEQAQILYNRLVRQEISLKRFLELPNYYIDSSGIAVNNEGDDREELIQMVTDLFNAN